MSGLTRSPQTLWSLMERIIFLTYCESSSSIFDQSGRFSLLAGIEYRDLVFNRSRIAPLSSLHQIIMAALRQMR